MKKKLVALLVGLVMTLPCVLPLQAKAWGGYMSISGEKLYHAYHCEELIGADYSKIKWYDTKKQAESAGLSPCELCEAGDWFDFEEMDEAYFVTNDKKLDAAFEAVLEYGAYTAEESALERFKDQYGYLEDEDGYNWGYQEGLSKGYNNGYEDGRADYENATYSDGFDDGFEKAESEAEDNLLEVEAKHAEELESVRSEIPWFTIIVVAVITFFTSRYFSAIKYEEEISKLKKESTAIEKKLQDQEDTMVIINYLAEITGTTPPHLATVLYINFRKSGGATEDQAKAELYDNKLRLKTKK